MKPIVHDLQTVYEEILQYWSTAVVSEQNRTGFANSTQPVSVTVIYFFLCYQYFCLYLRGKSWKVSWTRRGCRHLCDVHCSTEAESLFLTLETAVEKAISKQGPFSSCSGSFNHFTSSSSGDRMGFWTFLTMSFSSGGQSANSNFITRWWQTNSRPATKWTFLWSWLLFRCLVGFPPHMVSTTFQPSCSLFGVCYGATRCKDHNATN